jgi:methylenetetrahydrofolate reductase (NADPH)
MFIRDLFRRRSPVVSFEIFPPKREYPLETVYTTVEALRDLGPDFISVTYGAGGSSRERTVDIAAAVKERWGLTPLAHLTCLEQTEAEVDAVLDTLRERGIHNILALRGDPPQSSLGGASSGGEDFHFAADLVRHITTRHPGAFSIGAAAYPEGHATCDSLEEDLRHLKEKVEAGVDFLVTQLFFDNDLFFRFAERLDALDVRVPVTAGIMPVLNARQIGRIVSLSGASIPPKFARIMARYENAPEALADAGIAYATEQIIDLLSWGVAGVHLYTMNRPDVTRRIMANIASVRSTLAEEAISP